MTQIVVSKGNNVVRRGNIHLQEKREKKAADSRERLLAGSAALGQRARGVRVPGGVFH